ncbi:MAG: hypothetical protein IT548_09215 [Alphaproteobacteria bacterium]|nr:hypothetical protein [Alphaproteobacteria bacterium]
MQGALGIGHTPPDPDAPIGKSDFARRVGLSPSRISQLVRAGLPTTPAGKIVPSAGDAWMRDNVDPDRSRRAKGEPLDAPAPRGVKAAIDVERLELLRIEAARKRGELVDRKAAEAVIFARARAERDAHTAWVQRIAPTLAAELGSDAGRLFIALDREMRAHLERLSATPLEALGDG